MLGTSKNIWGFDPRSVPGCSLWLDGADSSTITLGTGSSVESWRDKVNGYAVANSSAAYRPVYSQGTIRFNGITSTSFLDIPTLTIGSSAFSIFFVMQNTGPASGNAYAPHFFWPLSGNGSGALSMTGWLNTNIQGINANTVSTLLKNQYYVISYTFGVTTNFEQVYANGISIGTYQKSSGYSASLYRIGAINTASTETSLDGNIGEILVYNTALTTSERQQVEGYLSHKWGLNGYYDSSIPLSIPGCQLWLDAADPAATGVTPSNGATVSTWVDKSGNGYNATAAPSRTAGTYSTSFRAVNFPTSTTGYITSYSAAPTNETMFVVFNNPSASFYNNILIGGVQGARSLGAAYSGKVGNSSVVGNLNTQVDWLANVGTYTLGTTALVTSQFTTSTNTISLNGGTAGSGGAPGFTAGRVTYLGVDATNGSFYYIGYAMEILFYNSVLNTTQRQSIEGYLARKWGLTSMYSALPSTHPFSSIRPHLRTFQPTDIPGCQLWLDGADQSSLVLSGSNVTSWNDKSENRFTGTAVNGPTVISNGLNGLPVIRFNGTNQYIDFGNILNLGTNGLSMFAVTKFAKPPDTIDNGGWIVGKTSYRGNYGRWGMGYDGYYASGMFAYYEDNTFVGSSFSFNPSTQFNLFSSQTNRTSFSRILQNGILGAQSNFSLTPTNMSSTDRLFVASYGNSTGTAPLLTYNLNGDIAEILVYFASFSDAQRQQVEGYLAHKWGLTTSLPVISPLSISGCTLWLDGADPAATGVTPSNGATVSTWVDKSGNGLTVSAASSQPTYVTNAANGLGTVAFNGSQGLSAGTVTGTKLIGNTNSCAIYAVVRFENTSGRSIPYSWDDQTYEARFLLQYAEGNNIALLKRGATATTIPLINTLYYIVSYWQNGLNTQLNVNGTTIASLSNFSNNDISSFSRVFNVGYYANDPAGWNMRGNIAEIIFFNTHIPNDFKKVEGYLARKWGISISATLPSLHPFKSFPPAKAPMIIGLVNRWIFNNGSGSTVTDTVGGQNISLSGTYTWSSSVPNSEIAIGSLSFDGYSGSGSASVNATLQTSTYTMTLWYYHTGVSDPYGGNPMILQSGFNQNEAFSFATGGFTGTSKPYFYSSVYNGGFGRTFSSATPLNTWTHLAVTIGNSTYNAYQNGVLDSGNTNISITSGLPLTLNGSFIFAKGDSAYGNRFGGSLFDVRIYNRALSASEISQIYNGIG